MTYPHGMRIGQRYRVTRASKHREFQRGDRVWLNPDGSISCPAAAGWMPADDIEAATEGWAIEPDVVGLQQGAETKDQR